MSRMPASENPFAFPGWLFPVLILALAAGYHFVKRQQTRHWETASGVIQTSEVRCRGLVKCRWDLSYFYRYQDRKYIGTRYRYRFESKSSAELEKLSAQYRHDMEVTVYVNPENPSEAVLDRGG